MVINIDIALGFILIGVLVSGQQLPEQQSNDSLIPSMDTPVSEPVNENHQGKPKFSDSSSRHAKPVMGSRIHVEHHIKADHNLNHLLHSESETKKDETSKKSDGVLIAGIIAGLLVALLVPVLAIAAVVFHRRKNGEKFELPKAEKPSLALQLKKRYMACEKHIPSEQLKKCIIL